jgi:prepilin-type processing-associated H-X9-DG protein
MNVARGEVLSKIRADAAIERHANASHFLYADWRVESVDSATIAEWAAAQTRTNNFCLPK